MKLVHSYKVGSKSYYLVSDGTSYIEVASEVALSEQEAIDKARAIQSDVPPEPLPVDSVYVELQKEIDRLKVENEVLKAELETLKEVSKEVPVDGR